MLVLRILSALAVALIVCCGSLLAAQSAGAERVQITLDSSEAEHVLAILSKLKQGHPVTDADWNALFATEPYRRLKIREESIHRPFTDEDFKKFVLSPEPLRNFEALSQTLAAWKKADLHASGVRVLQYLPAEARIRVKVFPEIKPVHNSFVFDMDTDPAIFLYLNPSTPEEDFENTVAHEMHHIGLASTEKLYEKKISSLSPEAQAAAQWMGGFGEGLAVLAAAGGPDADPIRYAKPNVRQNWVQGMGTFNQDLATVNQFFLDVLDGRLKGNAVDEKAFTFFGDVQGPWYTVGYKMAVLVEKRYGRAALIECMLDPRLLPLRYNQVADELNKTGKEHLATWSSQVLKGVGVL